MATNENLVIRMGGLGDLAILSSSLLALKEKEPWRDLILATLPQNVVLLAGVEYLDRVISIEESEKEEWFRVYDCRWGVEPPNIGPGKSTWDLYIGKDRSDLFDDLLGIRNGHKRFSLPINKDALAVTKTLLEDCRRRPIIGLSPTSRSPIRCMPLEYVEPLVQMLVKKMKASVVLFGKTEPWCDSLARLEIPGSLNIIDQLTVPGVVALCSQLDLIISPDTAIYHIVAALGRKGLAIFGNIQPKTRITYYPTVTALFPSQKEGDQLCHPFPCFDVPYPGCQRVGFGANCMRLFTPERIVEAVQEML